MSGKIVAKKISQFDTRGMKILTLNIKKVFFDQIVRGEKKIEYRELKQTTLNRYTYVDEADGNDIYVDMMRYVFLLATRKIEKALLFRF